MSNQAIPQDIVLDILSLLPVKSILRFQSVSKEWLSHINDPYFIKLHLKQSIKTRNSLKTILRPTYQSDKSNKLVSLGFASVNLNIPQELNGGAEIVGSCNGILCLLNRKRTHGSTLLMWNISTGEYKVLPDKPMEPHDESIDFPQNFLFTTEVTVYSLKTNSWRSCEQIPDFYYFFMNYWGVQYYTFVCGALHWFGEKDLALGGPCKSVIAFDFSTEKHHPIELPNGMEHKSYMALGTLRGCLCAIFAYRSDFEKVDVWIMKDYGVKDSWTMIHSLQYEYHDLRAAYLKLLWYDVKGEEFNDEDFPQYLKKFYYYRWQPPVICTESLVKLVDQRE
ncbi:hypothetical protein PTKIN_Ptkin01aG0026700 [Pterospermum kingtungense]